MMDGALALGIRDLTFRYAPDGPWIIDVPALDLERGAQLLLTGPSGCGKTTLLHLIAGLIDPSAGRLFVGGAEIHALRGAARDACRGRSIGVALAAPFLLPEFSAVENVMLAMFCTDLPRHEHRPRAEALLERVGIDAPAARPEALSAGQRRRIALARAVAARPVLVLADEPAAGPGETARWAELLTSICREEQCALLGVSRDDSTAPSFERTAMWSDFAPVPTPVPHPAPALTPSGEEATI